MKLEIDIPHPTRPPRPVEIKLSSIVIWALRILGVVALAAGIYYAVGEKPDFIRVVQWFTLVPVCIFIERWLNQWLVKWVNATRKP
jgi:hypothetical protein